MAIRVLIVDDSALVRQVLTRVLGEDPDIEVVGAAQDPFVARDMIKQLTGMLEPRTVRMIEEETLEFIKTNMNHLPMYYIPGREFK